jgi:phosphonate metabolism protein (transferase hexapeptide repeat family)
MELLIKNPFTVWLRWLLTALKYKMRYQHFQMEYLSEVTNCRFGIYNTIRKHARLRQVEMGDYSYVGRDSQVYEARVGKFTCIGPGVTIGPGEHPTDRISIHPMFYSTRAQSNPVIVESNRFEEMPITVIGHDVWIAQGAILRSGVRIGHGAIIAAGAVVVQDVPDYAVVGGVPAKIIKYRFDGRERERLAQIAWWDWDAETLRASVEKMNRPDLFFGEVKKYNTE